MASNFSPLSVNDMDPMFEALTAPEMNILNSKLNHGYETATRENAPRAILIELNTLCNMLNCAEYMKFGF